MSGSANIAAHLPAMAATRPDQPAIVIHNSCGTRSHSFAELNQRSDRIAHGLAQVGLARGMRAVLMVPPGPDFFALTFALFKLGAIPVFIDPGLGIRGVGRCLAEIDAGAFIGVPKAHMARMAFRWSKSAKLRITTQFMPGGGISLPHIERLGSRHSTPVMADVQVDDMAAVLFTSGSTGPAKGAVYTHGMFQEQVRTLRHVFEIQPGEWDLCTFPLFALFAPALGMSSVVPNMNASRPAKASPSMLVDFIRRFNVTNLFGSPALINVLSQYGEMKNITLPTLKRVISAGAPVAAAVIERMTRMLAPGVQVFTPYGATESLPVAVIGSDEVLGETRAMTDHGAGICVGRPVGRIEVAIIPISDEPIVEWSKVKPLPAGQIGEIAVRGPVVSPEYFRRPDATALAKIPDGSSFWHRMGDVGYVDAKGRLWFCGRKSQRVVTADRTYFTIPCEATFIAHRFAGQRAALVGPRIRGVVTPAICIESSRDLPSDLPQLAEQFEQTRGIKHFLNYRGSFPVDIRHNAKINREKLAAWAARRLR